MPCGRALRLWQNVSYIGTLLHYLIPVQRLIFAAYVVLVGVNVGLKLTPCRRLKVDPSGLVFG